MIEYMERDEAVYTSHGGCSCSLYWNNLNIGLNIYRNILGGSNNRNFL